MLAYAHIVLPSGYSCFISESLIIKFMPWPASMVAPYGLPRQLGEKSWASHAKAVHCCGHPTLLKYNSTSLFINSINNTIAIIRGIISTSSSSLRAPGLVPTRQQSPAARLPTCREKDCFTKTKFCQFFWGFLYKCPLLTHNLNYQFEISVEKIKARFVSMWLN